MDTEHLGVPGLDPLGVLVSLGVLEPEPAGVLDLGVLEPSGVVKPDGDVVHAGILGVVGLDVIYDMSGKMRALTGGDGIVANPALTGGSE